MKKINHDKIAGENGKNRMKEKIIKILIEELDYSEHVADVTADDLLKLHPQLQPPFQSWLENRKITNVEILGFSVEQLVKQRGYTFPSALISMDWLLTDSETAKIELSEEIRR